MSFENLPNQTQQNIQNTQTAKIWITWQDISYYLWGFIALLSVMLWKFGRWFFNREVNRFKQDTINDFQKNILTPAIKDIVNTIDSSVRDNLVKLNLPSISEALTKVQQKQEANDKDLINVKNELNFVKEELKEVAIGVNKVRAHYHNQSTKEVSIITNAVEEAVEGALKNVEEIIKQSITKSLDTTIKIKDQ